MLVGILTVQTPRGFSGNKQNFRDIIRAGKKRNIEVVVVPIEGINFTNKQCLGYKWEGDWKKTIFPLPNVIYNRISTRVAESRMQVKRAKLQLKRAGVPFFNESFFNKDELYRIVDDDPLTCQLLPETRILNLRNLKSMLGQYRQVYIKPVQSKAGKGIIRLDLFDSEVIVNQQIKGKCITQRSTIEKILKRLNRDSRFGEYVIQRAITLAKADGRPYDLRTLVQKDNTGNWRVTGIGARMAPINGILTHVPNGGVIRETSEVLEASFADSEADIIKDVKEQIILLANVIEHGLPGILGEMSIDIGVDEDAKLWFFEANAKPMKFDEPEIRSLSLQRILEYCEFLAETN